VGRIGSTIFWSRSRKRFASSRQSKSSLESQPTRLQMRVAIKLDSALTETRRACKIASVTGVFFRVDKAPNAKERTTDWVRRAGQSDPQGSDYAKLTITKHLGSVFSARGIIFNDANNFETTGQKGRLC
jgi:hypothetical protein